MTELVHPDERVDDLQINGLKLIQNPKGFCFGMDAVLLSNFVHIKKGQKAVDLGCGNGIISILLTAKTQADSITGVEIQRDVAQMALRSVELNNLGERVKILNIDLKEAPVVLGKSSFDVVVTNPPYRTSGCGIVNPEDSKAVARHEILCSLEDVISTSKALLKPGGKFFMVHRPDRLVDIICTMRQYKLEPKKLRFVHPRIGNPPNMVLIEALRDGNSYIKVDKPLYIYDGEKYSEEVLNIYNTAAGC